jgi:predicted RNase H-like nuclease (RuvC/YqgF family)
MSRFTLAKYIGFRHLIEQGEKEFSSDDAFDVLEELLGIENIGYIAIVNAVRKLKEEKETLQELIDVEGQLEEKMTELEEENKKLKEENKKLKEQIEQDATPHIIETVREWFIKSNSNPLDFVRWTNADPVIMIQKILKDHDEYYEKQKDYDEIIGELGIMIENIDQNACDVFNKLTEKYRDEFERPGHNAPNPDDEITSD